MAKPTIAQDERRIQERREQFFNKRWIDARKNLENLISFNNLSGLRAINA